MGRPASKDAASVNILDAAMTLRELAAEGMSAHDLERLRRFRGLRKLVVEAAKQPWTSKFPIGSALPVETLRGFVEPGIVLPRSYDPDPERLMSCRVISFAQLTLPWDAEEYMDGAGFYAGSTVDLALFAVHHPNYRHRVGLAKQVVEPSHDRRSVTLVKSPHRRRVQQMAALTALYEYLAFLKA